MINSEVPTVFPNANIVEVDATAGLEYYNKTTTSYAQEGAYIPDIAEIIYTDAREFLSFPMSYGDETNSTFAGTVENILANQTFNRAGDVEITSDAYGELILPYATIQNVLRVRSVYLYTDEYLGMELYNYTDTIYTYFNASNQTQLASYTTVYANGSLLAHQATYLNEADFVSSINEEIVNEENLRFYPNPAKNKISIENDHEISSIAIYDLNGKVVQNEELQSGIQQISLDNLSSSVYYLKI